MTHTRRVAFAGRGEAHERVAVGAGWVQRFQKGAISQRGGAAPVHLSGFFATAWRAAGAEGGVLG